MYKYLADLQPEKINVVFSRNKITYFAIEKGLLS